LFDGAKGAAFQFYENDWDVECKGDYRLELAIDSEIDDARVSEDMQSLYVGSKSGNIRVTISGYGEVAEYVSEETIIHVSLGETERKEMRECARVIAKKADAYITSQEEYHSITLEQAIYTGRIYYADKREVISLDMKYKKDDGSDLYMYVEYGVVNGDDKFSIGERNLFETLSYVVSGQNDAFINIGDDVYARLHDVSSDGEVFELDSYEYIFLIDIA